LSTSYCGKSHFAESHEMISAVEEILDVHWRLSLCSQIKLVLIGECSAYKLPISARSLSLECSLTMVILRLNM
jgi:hypothetical protein